MNRSDSGLVRRVKTKNGDSDANSSNSLASNLEDGNDENQDGETELDDCDSKETRLTLMEEVLLLGLKDKEVCFFFFSFLFVGYFFCRDIKK